MVDGELIRVCHGVASDQQHHYQQKLTEGLQLTYSSHLRTYVQAPQSLNVQNGELHLYLQGAEGKHW
jgi:hypothetical protein